MSFKVKANGRSNICGVEIARRRSLIKPYVSQNALAAKLQIMGLDLDKNAIQRIECGKRYINDIELMAFAKVFKIDVSELYPSGSIVFD